MGQFYVSIFIITIQHLKAVSDLPEVFSFQRKPCLIPTPFLTCLSRPWKTPVCPSSVVPGGKTCCSSVTQSVPKSEGK